MNFESLPGGAVIREGLDDLQSGRTSVPSLLVRVGAPRLRRLGLPVPGPDQPGVEHALYREIERTHGIAAHSRYNALIRLLVSFERAAECAR